MPMFADAGDVPGCSSNSSIYENDPEVPQCSTRSRLATVMLAVYLLLVNILLINLLIAMFRYCSYIAARCSYPRRCSSQFSLWLRQSHQDRTNVKMVDSTGADFLRVVTIVDAFVCSVVSSDWSLVTKSELTALLWLNCHPATHSAKFKRTPRKCGDSIGLGWLMSITTSLHWLLHWSSFLISISFSRPGTTSAAKTVNSTTPISVSKSSTRPDTPQNRLFCKLAVALCWWCQPLSLSKSYHNFQTYHTRRCYFQESSLIGLINSFITISDNCFWLALLQSAGRSSNFSSGTCPCSNNLKKRSSLLLYWCCSCAAQNNTRATTPVWLPLNELEWKRTTSNNDELNRIQSITKWPQQHNGRLHISTCISRF